MKSLYASATSSGNSGRSLYGPLSTDSRWGPRETYLSTEGISAAEGVVVQGGSLETYARVAESRASESAPCCTGATALSLLRTCAVSLLAWAAVGGYTSELWAVSAEFRLPFLACALIMYAYELRRRQTFWSIVWPGEGNSASSFASRIQELQDAAPEVMLQGPKGDVEHTIVEWRDETQDSDATSGGLFYITFPLIILPGDESEASALDYHRARVVSGAEQKLLQFQTRSGTAALADFETRIRFNDGTCTHSPAPHILAVGEEACCCQMLLVIAVPLLLALVADELLLTTLTHRPWFVRKRYFTLAGTGLGKVRFILDHQGVVHLDGEEAELRQANTFWATEEDWELMWSCTRSLAFEIRKLRALRIVANCLAGFALIVVVLAFTYDVRNAQTQKSWHLLGFGVLLMILFVFAAGCADCVADSRMLSCEKELRDHFSDKATCSASWSFERSELIAVSLQQKQPTGSN